jgi:NhaP-type Na+/H+ and K+/H+ antiporter
MAFGGLLLAMVLFGLLLQGFALALIAHRLRLVLPSEEAEPT